MINEALATLDDITHWAPAGSCTSLHMLRLDRLHAVVSGNKWYKLKYNAAEAKARGKDSLLTFGGGYSNHLIATAYAAQEWGLKSIGIVRGHYSGEHFTQTLRDCEAYGMQLIMESKQEYVAYKSSDKLLNHFPYAYTIPEGGANEAGIQGAAEIASLIPGKATDVCLAVGTGTTLKGLYTALPPHTRLHGFYVAKDFERTQSLINRAAEHPDAIFHQVHDTRFGKWTDEAVRFIRYFHESTGILLDVVYTSKMMMKVQRLLQDGSFAASSRLVCIHTGGLQGNPAGLFP
jgi:1-aminocyclopropane-1-carboxylate deaminase